jgi:phage gp36-like protein
MRRSRRIEIKRRNPIKKLCLVLEEFCACVIATTKAVKKRVTSKASEAVFEILK